VNINQAAVIWTIVIVAAGIGFAEFSANFQSQIDETSTDSSIIMRSGAMAQQGILQIEGINTMENNTLVTTPLNTLTSKITVSAWVEPDYIDSAAELTVISKEDSFILSINNNIPPKYVAKLAIYDGIHWTEITGASEIHGLSHIVGVIDENTISLYVNGMLEKQKKMADVFVVDSGKLNIKKAEIARSEEDVIVGAYVSTLRESVDKLNIFSGIIDDVKIYDDEALTGGQIYEIYQAKSFDNFSNP
jgi:hypothetical protein